MTLRPIGTIFKTEYPPTEGATNSVFTIVTYKIVDHIKVARFLGDKEGYMTEQLDVINIEEPPAKLLYEYKDSEWKYKWVR